jgi:protein subunit release factor A
MQEIIIEIRDAEGGEDSKLLVKDMVGIYLKWATNNKIDSKILETRDGFVSI